MPRATRLLGEFLPNTVDGTMAGNPTAAPARPSAPNIRLLVIAAFITLFMATLFGMLLPILLRRGPKVQPSWRTVIRGVEKIVIVERAAIALSCPLRRKRIKHRARRARFV